MKELTQEQKIDYIFETLHKQERRRIFKVILKILFLFAFIGYLIYFYMFGLDILIEKMKSAITPDISQIEGLNLDSIDKDSLLEILKTKLNELP